MGWVGALVGRRLEGRLRIGLACVLVGVDRGKKHEGWVAEMRASNVADRASRTIKQTPT